MAATRYSVDYGGLSDHERLILHVLRLYYEHDLTQVEVARRMGFSRPKVPRTLISTLSKWYGQRYPLSEAEGSVTYKLEH